MGAPTHFPPEHWSGAVHAFPSLHVLLSLFVCTHDPVVGLHESSVHGLSSLQFGPVPGTHEPAEQWSPIVHAFPSLHATVLFVCVQPVAGAQASVVHTLLSSQFSAVVPGTHAPPEQTSPTVHAFPSLQGVLSGWLAKLHVPSPLQVPACLHVPGAAQAYAVPAQAPAVHTSFFVHATPSLQPVPFVALAKLHVPSPLQVPACLHVPGAAQV